MSMEMVPLVHAWSGAAGDYKAGPTYATTIVPFMRSSVNQKLWLIGDDKRITEATGMNMFAVIEETGAGTDIRDP